MTRSGRGTNSGEVPERFDPGVSNPSLMRAEHWARYWVAAQLSRGRRVLDAGCGTGYGTRLLADSGAQTVTGIDIAADAVAAARECCPEATIIEANLLATGIASESFDVIACFEVIEHLEDHEGLLSELSRLLAPNGVLLVSSPNRNVYPAGNPHHVRELTPEELDDLVGRHFKHLALFTQHSWLASAVLGAGMSAGADPQRGERSLLVKVDGAGRGSETYTLTAASDSPLPDLEQVVALCEPEDLREYSAAVKALERRVREAEQVARLAGERRIAADREAEAAEERRRIAEDELRDARQHLARANAAIVQITGSLSWRATAPLRRLKR